MFDVNNNLTTLAADYVGRFFKGCMHMGSYFNSPHVVEFIPVDFVAHAIVSLSEPASAIGTIYHLANPNTLSFSKMGEMMVKAGIKVKGIVAAYFRLVDAQTKA